MKRALGVAAVLVASVVSAQGSEITPSDVVYEDGAVVQSLTGVAGNAEEGAKIMNKGAGNCIACHEVTALSHLPFHGEVGPMLDGAADRWSEAELRGIVANAKMMFDGTVMPSFYKTDGFVRLGNAYTGKAHEGDVDPLLTAQQIEDVVAYLMTLTDE
ncbi:MAG: sulfur oxidation c-type cytochrome SoxX [Shimia sp.]|uniref:sulfur oxidation c-type cytochrome SoxX n=1 Tax=Shimia sp. TaxID=1954381 RepID=UPI001A0934B4|nr:sulfur oxidation c-type cytochrome SoxX [Shimia sp.]MBE1294337.1 sulfur oxidation c-type cytochrome SoxX [Paracoccaceae bacterium]MBO6895897.1 sulfur oxidation c-type cytochrome SoxX [Shimia sp.]